MILQLRLQLRQECKKQKDFAYGILKIGVPSGIPIFCSDPYKEKKLKKTTKNVDRKSII